APPPQLPPAPRPCRGMVAHANPTARCPAHRPVQPTGQKTTGDFGRPPPEKSAQDRPSLPRHRGIAPGSASRPARRPPPPLPVEGRETPWRIADSRWHYLFHSASVQTP